MKKFMKGAAITGGIFLLLGLIVFGIGAIGGGIKDIREKYATAVTLKDKLENSTLSINLEDLEEIADFMENSDMDELSELSELGDLSELAELTEIEELSELTDILAELGITDGEELAEILSVFDGVQINGLDISFGTGSITISSDLFETDKPTYEDGEFTFENVTGNDVEIRVGAGRLTVKYHSENTIKLDVGKNDRMQCFSDGKTIYIIGGCLKNNGNSDMTVYLPEGINYEDMVIDVAAGNFEMDELLAQKVIFDVGMGNVNVSDMHVDSLEAAVGMGNMEVTGIVNEEAAVDVGMGQIVLKLIGNSTDYNYTLDCGMGSLSVEDVYTIAGIGSQDINNNAEKDIEASCGMGNIEVRFE